MNINPPAPPPPPLRPEPPPPATTNTSADVTPVGTLNVPDDVNDSVAEGTSEILNALELVFEFTSDALNVKFVVVKEATSVVNVPVILYFDTPFSCTVLADNPAGSEPDCNSKVTFPADSGSYASMSIVEIVDCSTKKPTEPEAVLNTGEASILI